MFHCLFATDGVASPTPLLPWFGKVDEGLVEERKAEARAAAKRLGLPGENLHFLDLPDGRLGARRGALESALSEFNIGAGTLISRGGIVSGKDGALTIGPRVNIGAGCNLYASTELRIGADTMLAAIVAS